MGDRDLDRMAAEGTMVDDTSPAVRELIQRLDDAVRLASVERVTRRIKEDLEDFSARGAGLPAALCRPAAGSYARRLLHRAPGGAWTRGRHDLGSRPSAPICTTTRVSGASSASCRASSKSRSTTSWSRTGARCRFSERSHVRAGVGDAGCLIPPFEYHVLGNALADRTERDAPRLRRGDGPLQLLHGGRDGWWERTAKRLEYIA